MPPDQWIGKYANLWIFEVFPKGWFLLETHSVGICLQRKRRELRSRMWILLFPLDFYISVIPHIKMHKIVTSKRYRLFLDTENEETE